MYYGDNNSVGFKNKAYRGGLNMTTGRNQIVVTNAKEALNRMKFETARELGVNLTDGYNGHLTSREAGSIGGNMVKKLITIAEQNM